MTRSPIFYKIKYMRVLLLCLIFLSHSANALEELKDHINNKDLGGLDQILKDRYIRILTTKNAFDYYLYQGRAKGIQYEMAKHFTRYLNKKYTKPGQLKIVFEMIPVDYDQLIPLLLEGRGDIIAAGLTPTPARRKQVRFARPYRKVDEVIVTHKNHSKGEWKDKMFHVRRSSSYYDSLVKAGLDIKTVDEQLHTENILELISLGKFQYTVADSYLAKSALNAFPDLEILSARPFRKDEGIAWAVRPNNLKLLKVINQFIPKVRKGTLLGNIINKKYFSDLGKIQSEEFDLKSSTLSRYDKLIKKYSKKYGFDWRLIAALCYQESRFRQNISNRWGAIGLFQIKQQTANEPYINIPKIKGLRNAENNIHAGIKYLSWIKKRYFDPKKNMDESDRLRFTMAAYNAGPARVLKALKRARKMKLKTNEWFRQVELAMLRMGYNEPVSYVSEINKRYVSYLLLGIK